METETKFDYETYIVEVAEAEGMNVEAFEALCDNFMHTEKDEIDAAVNDYQNYYIGEMTTEEYADELAQELYPEAYDTGYFNVEQFAYDLECGGDIWESNGHLFRSY
jgi:methionyl-tRNA synthetase